MKKGLAIAALAVGMLVSVAPVYAATVKPLMFMPPDWLEIARALVHF